MNDPLRGAAALDAAPFRARVIPAEEWAGEIQRMGSLTRESVQALLDDSGLVGRGARVEIRLLAPAGDASQEWLDALAKGLRVRGIALRATEQGARLLRPVSAARAAA